MLLWTAALFIVLELISGNIVEPWLYGASTGLSSIAILAAAIFWTWLWGPVGLLLSTPLTVCLVVLGRHVPQFGFLNVLLGSEPVLEPAESLYQRLLAGDPDEATERAEEYLRTHSILDYYEEVAIPALSMFEHDRARGVLTDERRALVAAAALTLVDNLSEHEDANGRGEVGEAPLSKRCLNARCLRRSSLASAGRTGRFCALGVVAILMTSRRRSSPSCWNDVASARAWHPMRQSQPGPMPTWT